MILQSFEFFSRCPIENRESVQLLYQAENSRTTQNRVSRVAASTYTVTTDTISNSGTFNVSSAGVNMDNISSLPNDSIVANCFAAAF